MTSNVLEEVTLAVLAGGAGSRMGVPKVKLRIEDKPILTWLLDRLDWRGPTMLVLAPAIAAAAGSERFDIRVSDPVDGQGPLRGILTALENLQTPMLAVITVDMPGISHAQLDWLIQRLSEQSGLAGIMCQVGSAHDEHVEPFPSIFRAVARKVIAQRLAGGRLSVQQLITDPGFAAISPPANWPATTWANLNTRDDLATFESTVDNMEGIR